MFSAAAPSIEARTVMGARGLYGEFRGPSFNGDQAFLTGTLCDSLSLSLSMSLEMREREIPMQIKQNVFIANELSTDENFEGFLGWGGAPLLARRGRRGG